MKPDGIKKKYKALLIKILVTNPRVEQIHQSVVPFEVDLVRYSSVSNRELLEHIIRDGVVWYSKIDSLHTTQQ